MHIKFDFNNKTTSIKLGQINVFYGYNKSGKTFLAKTLYEGFNQKYTTAFQINGAQVSKSNFETIYLDSTSSLDNHLKLGSKSYIKKKYLNNICSIINNDNSLEEYIFNKLSCNLLEINQLLDSLNSNSNNKLLFKLNLEDIEDIILSNIKVSYNNEYISTSESRILLLNIVLDYIKINNIHKIVIIDDFDSYLDEENTNAFLSNIEQCENATFVLTTSKSTSLQFILGKHNVFTIKNNYIFDLTNIKRILNASLINSNENINNTFEDYMVDNRIIILDSEYQEMISNIQDTSFINLGRMLVNQKYSIDKVKNNPIFIKSTSKMEKEFLEYLDSLFYNN